MRAVLQNPSLHEGDVDNSQEAVKNEEVSAIYIWRECIIRMVIQSAFTEAAGSIIISTAAGRQKRV